ncbi:MAG: OsmC family protein [Gemmatimonadaceae bacterium]|nr:OsmC family protein [Gemmatimonadaceae bacterium]
MKIILTSESSIRLVPDAGPMTIEAPKAEQQYSPFHMLGSSLAFCTFSVMYAWATHGKIPVDDLTLDVSWEFAEDPHRVGTIAVSFDWPSLPAKRVNAAKRAAELCTVHATLMHSPQITITSATEEGSMDSSDTSDRDAAAGADTTTGTDTSTQQHAHADGATHAHPGGSGEHTHRGPDAIENARDLQAESGAADLPPRPAQQGDGQEAGTTKPPKPPVEAR